MPQELEPLSVLFESAEFDKLVHENSLPQFGPVIIGVKEGATVNKNPVL
jgi:hypothetical protein